ncbi:hypothetical protein TNCV_3251 [Trichonephila clavipes]|nr:hypothetical protein TNCV_3251 [Trichonephila clavipes]
MGGHMDQGFSRYLYQLRFLHGTHAGQWFFQITVSFIAVPSRSVDALNHLNVPAAQKTLWLRPRNTFFAQHKRFSCCPLRGTHTTGLPSCIWTISTVIYA